MNRLRVLLVAGALPFRVGVVGRRSGRVAVAGVCAMLAACAALPGSSLASTRFGSSLTATPNMAFICQNPCVETFANTSLPAGAPPLTSPVTGTIVRWRFKTGSGADGTIQLRVLAPAGGGQFTGAGTGPSEATPTTATTATFSARLPIKAGDSIGVDASLAGGVNSQFRAASTQAGASFAQWLPSLADGGTAAPSANQGNSELLVNADVAALPTSSVAIPACTTTGTVAATVTSDPDPDVAPKAIHFRIDGGTEQTQATSGNPGSAAISVPNGSHTLEYWGEDSVGGLESAHNMATVVGCSATAGGSGTTTGTPGGGPTGTTAPTLASNAFSVAGAKQLRNGSIRLTLISPGAGAYRAVATFRGKSRFAQPAGKRKTTTGTFGTAAATATAAGAVTLVIRPTRQARAALRRTRRLRVSVAITFTPNGGNPSTQTKTVSVKKLKAKKKRRGR